MSAELVAWITAIDGPRFAALILAVCAFFMYTANQVAKLGQSQAVSSRTRPTSSNRKAGRA